ncbi:AfsR/SARP family transcriptional regulator, partial [Actinomadura roseirufa]|uniref:AfsR/SARP family transcriptional regulator n=1 Tax=Actinomadura roseirufa TaxID=2094049 RepID=UPI00104145DF
MRFGVLGPLTVRADGGEAVTVPEPKVRTLLAVLLEGLLTDPGRPVSADRLIDALWGDRPPRNPTGTLQARVSQLRGVLEGAEPGGRALVALRPTGYVLDVPPDAVDAGRFAALTVRAGECADAAEKARLLGDALALWRGPAFDGFTDAEFARAASAGLEERRLTALEERAEARLAPGESAGPPGRVAAQVVDELAAAVAGHPLRERLRAAHLRALYRSGRRGEALASYHELRERLADELGIDPGPALVALYQAMLDEDPSLDPPAPRAHRGTEAPREETPREGALPAAPRVPVPLGELIGREDAVRRARAFLASDRLVTLTGTGGVGKTRLALETAARSAEDHPDGVWVVELASGRPETAAEVAEQAARVLGLRDGDGSGDPVERLADALRARRTLLVLDNCEHVLDPVAELAERLLAAAPGLRILVTAQEPLGLAGERLQIVPPLDLPGHGTAPEVLAESAAVRLFVARAAAAAPGFALDVASAPWVASICRRLDGVPLALELAATRVRALGVKELAARLDDRFRVLAGGRRGGPARQQTLRATIDWSWGLLTGPERVALRRLAVHAGGCTLEAAEEVGGAGVDVLARLVDRSLAVRAGDRYRLLESVAAYSLERLEESGEADEVRRRHVLYYTGLVERAADGLRGPEQCRWLERLDQETANLGAALEHASDRLSSGDLALRLVNAQGWYWYLRGRFGEARRALGTALTIPDADPAPITRARLMEARMWLTGITMASGEGTDSEELRQGALKAYAQADGLARAKAEWFLSHVHWPYGDLAANEARVNGALAVFRAHGDRWGTAAALATRAKMLMGHGDLDGMRRDGTESLELFTALGDDWGRLEAGDVLSRHAEVTGDHEAAGRLRRAELRLAEELRMWPDVAYRLGCLGRVALLTGDLAEARALHERALALAVRQAARSAAEFAEI